MSASVLIADATVTAHAPIPLALRAVGFDVVRLCASTDEVTAALEVVRPDIALVSRDLPGDGLEAAERLVRAQPGVIVVLRCEELADDDLVTAVRLGVRGFLPASLELTALASNMLAALRGEAILTRTATVRVLEAYQRREASKRAAAASSLTAREWEILELLADGGSTAEIAGALGVERVTVRSHLATLRKKLGAQTGEGAADALRQRVDAPAERD